MKKPIMHETIATAATNRARFMGLTRIRRKFVIQGEYFSSNSVAIKAADRGRARRGEQAVVAPYHHTS